jgi:hypothetical protein
MLSSFSYLRFHMLGVLELENYKCQSTHCTQNIKSTANHAYLVLPRIYNLHQIMHTEYSLYSLATSAPKKNKQQLYLPKLVTSQLLESWNNSPPCSHFSDVRYSVYKKLRFMWRGTHMTCSYGNQF